MTDVILVAHGRLAEAMKNSAEMIFGELKNVYPLQFLVGEGLDTVVDRITEQMKSVTSDSVVIITDIFSGTPFNAACAYSMAHPDQNVRVISGMSLPIVLEVAAMRQEHDADAIVNHVLEVGKDSIRTFDKSSIEEEEDL
ncbi:PTS sugar transporter subunit IIA [Catenisphaera adipataccumulans]|jgi:mannose/fructose/sorbose-specific phosphotransferase system IIA component|uniref:Mannose/fructose/sorbose-specific phosphotransferase system IIA component n=1 Tax=Catenisphaera adipataccumulans TaxID=700500 RepID=A0A7W8CYM1_9FIRM|nr:PTS sugar transporter subunit IIA [Catenisphaera adipataccumulans]MBB5182794.1 mannose/fructose/sorbose-specific phosphotransferase system IIA component [Catenisphaera adipataccumulans]